MASPVSRSRHWSTKALQRRSGNVVRPIGRGGRCLVAVGRWSSTGRDEAFRSGAPAEDGAGLPRPDSVRAARGRRAGALFGGATGAAPRAIAISARMREVLPRPRAHPLSRLWCEPGESSPTRRARVLRGGGVPGLRAVTVMASPPGPASFRPGSSKREVLDDAGRVEARRPLEFRHASIPAGAFCIGPTGLAISHPRRGGASRSREGRARSGGWRAPWQMDPRRSPLPITKDIVTRSRPIGCRRGARVLDGHLGEVASLSKGVSKGSS